MTTQHIHRLFIVAPTGAKANFLNNWLRENFDPTGDDWLSVPLSADGTEPATHLACDTALTDVQLRAFFEMLRDRTGSEFPTNWNARNRSQKVSWVRQAAIPWLWTNYGLGLLHVNNDGGL